ncbi:GTPase HflX [Coprobacillaceae bacterium CR2/5/TPMF4]|nr:GTPase HflX [Coprobacillaceae bacterium CR2/5/TPMF4]
MNPSLYLGTGKVQEIKNDLDDIDIVIFDEELSPLQVKNLTDILDIEVTDRTDLILRIFEVRAQSKEAKLQVEIAKGQYLLPRLAGMKEHLYSQQGGSGFRGSGEKQIELDRRLIANQITQAKRQLAKIVKQRQTQRRKRKDNELPVIALVGYTNSGKSTLLNAFVIIHQNMFYRKICYLQLYRLLLDILK